MPGLAILPFPNNKLALKQIFDLPHVVVYRIPFCWYV